jgi:glutaredoxin
MGSLLKLVPAMATGLRFLLRLCLPAWLLCLSFLAFAASPPSLKVYLFSAKGCPHCLEAKKFLAKLEGKYPHLRVVELELSGSRENQEIFKKFAARLQVEIAGVPCIVIGATHFVGWQDEHSTGAAIERAILAAEERPPPDLIAPLLTPETRLPELGSRNQIPETLSIPMIGTVETQHLSLGLLTVIIGAMDGFNPCAMWALLFLIGLLLGMENRTRMWVLGGLFIGGSGLVYFFFMTAWLNILIFLGLVVWIRVAIGGVALVAAGVNLREYFLNRGGACTLMGGERRQSLMARIKNAIEHESFLLAAVGILFLGVAVNLVELFCSMGLPVVYTQTLIMSRLPVWQYYAYMALYIFIFMLDDIIVFVVSMLTLQHFGLNIKYSRFSNLIGGLVLLVVGLLLIFRPDVLMFG